MYSTRKLGVVTGILGANLLVVHLSIKRIVCQIFGWLCCVCLQFPLIHRWQFYGCNWRIWYRSHTSACVAIAGHSCNRGARVRRQLFAGAAIPLQLCQQCYPLRVSCGVTFVILFDLESQWQSDQHGAHLHMSTAGQTYGCPLLCASKGCKLSRRQSVIRSVHAAADRTTVSVA